MAGMPGERPLSAEAADPSGPPVPGTGRSGPAEQVAAATGSAVRAVRPLSGGDICDAYRMELADGRTVFAKTLAGAPADFFRAEAAGLRALAATGAVAVPRVLAVRAGVLVLEFVRAGAPDAAQAERLGRELAALHCSAAPQWGNLPGPCWPGQAAAAGAGAGAARAARTAAAAAAPAAPETPGTPGAPGPAGPCYLGPLPLSAPYPPDADPAGWPVFHAEHRLLPALRLAVDRGAMARGDARVVEELCARIEEVAGPPQPPALIHGDLWHGNVMWSADGRGRLIDPAAQGGHPETDLALLELFGCPYLERILAAYAEIRPLPGRERRRPLHQLHHLLVHAALFGAGYGAQCGAAARAALTG
ncbi:fructosamine kinase family protein [Streptomyces aidingensis]|uniref:Fructosamine-3-kinase n=1 Tax=Streptomyces aidingensis TaxID=910347 RepID=A0A1I1QHR0_9ACTN|nr:fructosamine kinase family protein [Streptomyces aidingensis]SFD21585.1 Fructosamine-3-kinase [Streptomyces aidingensis]